MKLRYRVVDVFTKQPLEGNALAVFPEPAALDDATMQKIAREMNLSETVFILPSDRSEFAARVRIFTPSQELPFAGHPTVGASFVMLNESIVPPGASEFTLDERVGPVPIRVEPGDQPLIWLRTPPITFGNIYGHDAVARALGLEKADLVDDVPPQIASAGYPFLFVALKERGAVNRAWLDASGAAAIKIDGPDKAAVFVFTPTSEGAYSRMFAPQLGIPEDPATGSATGPLAAYMMKHALAPNTDGTRFISEQGAKMGRRSFLHIHLKGEMGRDGIEVGGYVTPVAEGTLTI